MEPEFEHLLPANWQHLVQTWLHEDIPGFDIGGFVVGNKAETALLYGKADGVLAGRPFFDCVFDLLDCKVWSSITARDICEMSMRRHIHLVRMAAS